MSIGKEIQEYFEITDNDSDLDYYRFRTKEVFERVIDCIETLNFIAEKNADSDARISIDRLVAKMEDLE